MIFESFMDVGEVACDERTFGDVITKIKVGLIIPEPF